MTKPRWAIRMHGYQERQAERGSRLSGHQDQTAMGVVDWRRNGLTVHHPWLVCFLCVRVPGQLTSTGSRSKKVTRSPSKWARKRARSFFFSRTSQAGGHIPVLLVYRAVKESKS